MAIFDIDGVESRIGYSFKDKILLRTCFTHASYAHEHGHIDNERLEFFGDSIMEFVVTEYLYNKGSLNEGEMTKIRAEIVSKDPLLKAIKQLDLTQFVLLSHGLLKNSSQDEKLYSSVYEALVAGIYLDGGIKPVRKFITKTLIAEYEKNKKNTSGTKTRFYHKVDLQEFVQKHKLGSLSYLSLSKSGPDHAPEFKEAVLLNGTIISEGVGKSKQYAQNSAAKVALEKIKQGR